MKYERVVDKLRGSEALCVRHELESFNPLARGGRAGIGRRGGPYCETGRGQSDSNGNQSDLAHLRSPVQSAQDGGSSHLMKSNMPGRAFGRCGGHHEMVDSISEKGLGFRPLALMKLINCR